MDFKFDYNRQWTNEIRGAVGPTTSHTARALVDSNTAHFLYLSDTTGNDANSGFSPGLAKKTIDAAYAALTGSRQVIQILDSATYTATTSLIFYDMGPSNGIQAALGETPIITFDAADLYIDFNSGSNVDFVLSGVIVISPESPGMASALSPLVAVAYSSGWTDGLLTIKNCTIYNRMPESVFAAGPSPHDQAKTFYMAIFDDVFGQYHIQQNIFLNLASSNPVYLVATAHNNIFSQNVVLQGSTLVTGENLYDYDTVNTYLPSLLVDFTSTTLQAVVNGGGTPTSLTPNQWNGYRLSMAGATEPFYILYNDATTFYLENRWGSVLATGSAIVSIVEGLVIEAAVLINEPTSGANQLLMQRNLIIGKGQRSAIAHYGNEAADSNTLTFEGNYISNFQYGITNVIVPTAPDPDIATNADQNIFNTNIVSGTLNPAGSVMPPVATTLTITNTYTYNPPLFFDQTSGMSDDNFSDISINQDGYATAAYWFRLRQLGKKFYSDSTTYMYISSQLIELYNGTTDLDPWTETTPVLEATYDSQIALNYPPASINISYVPKNPIELYDLRGNPRIDWDAWRKEFTLAWQNDYAHDMQIWDLYRLYEDKFPKRWYLRGIGQNLLPDSDGNGALNGIDSTTAEFEPAGLTTPLVPHHWKGLYITIDSGFDYYISDNSNETFIIVDKYGVGFPPDGTYAFSIEYMLVHCRVQLFTFGQQNFTSFFYGGQWEEFSGVKPYEYTTPSIILIEAENPGDE